MGVQNVGFTPTFAVAPVRAGLVPLVLTRGMGDEDLLAQMVRSKYGWGAADLDRLYLSFGFRKREGAKHTVYDHPADPLVLRATVARHSSLAVGYVQTAIRLIRHLKRIQEAE